MTPKNYRSPSSNISRRDFLKLATAAGLLAGCRTAEQPAATPTNLPTDIPVPTNTPQSTATPVVVVAGGRPDVIKMYPDVPSRVVHTHHAGVWDGDNLLDNIDLVEVNLA
jgi:hypothetical protein